MMDKLRNAANHTAFKIIFALIMLSFVFAGVGLSGLFSSESNNSGLYAAKVNGKPIQNADLDFQLDSMLSQTRQKVNDEQRRQLRAELLNKNISDALLLDYAVDNGFRVTDEQVKNEIRNQPEFQENGKFSNERYLQILNASGFTPAVYADAMRSYLTRVQATKAVVNSDFVLPEDLNVLALKNQKRTAYIGTISTQTLIDNVPEFTKDDFMAYYDANKKNYEREDMIRVEYVGISLKDLDKKINVTDNEINKYYQANIAEFTKPERQSLSLIRVKTKEEADSILSELKKANGTNFDSLAKEKSSNPVLRDSAGYMGWYEINKDTPAEILKSGLKKKGDLSAIIEMDGEFGIFKLNDVEPAVVKPKAEVKDQITKQLRDQKGLDLLDETQKALTESVQKTPKSLENAAKLIGMDKVEKSYWIEKNNDQYSFFAMAELNTALNMLYDEQSDSGVASEVIYVNQPDNQYLFLLRISDYFKKGVMPFEMTSALVERHYKNNWLGTELSKKTQYVLSELDKGNTNVLRTEGITFVKPHVLTRDSKEFDGELISKIFAAPVPTDGKPVYGYHNSIEKGATFFALINVKNEEQHDDKEKLQLSVEQSREQLESFTQSLRDRAKVVIHDSAKL